MKWCFICCMCCLFSISWGQQATTNELKGQLINVRTNEAVSYVTIDNLTLKRGTISDENGFFKLPLEGANDSIRITSIEYKTVAFVAVKSADLITVYLEPLSQEIEEITIQPKDQTYLFELLHKVSKQLGNDHRTAKAYYYLRTFRDTSQVELIEGYYNLKMKGTDMDEISLKAGRFGLSTPDDRYFSSVNGVKAIANLRLFEQSALFPETPLSVKKKTAKQHFNLSVESKYTNESGDSIYLLKYFPYVAAKGNFSGKIWLNISKSTLQKITMNCQQCAVHPFRPMFLEYDSIGPINLSITKTFKEEGTSSFFQETDFTYELDYYSRLGKDYQRHYPIQTKAVIVAYDYGQQFTIPAFQFDDNQSDYMKLNAFPYNRFFWENANELRLNQQVEENDYYFKHRASVSNQAYFKSILSDTMHDKNLIRNKGFFGLPYIHWSKNRILLKEMLPDSTVEMNANTVIADRYHLEVQLFVDINRYNDSIHVLTDVVFDPYKTFYYLPIDLTTNCFINLFFDFCELQRRSLQQQLEQAIKSDPENVQSIYETFLVSAEKERDQFLKSVDRGLNLKAMEEWNAKIYNQLGIDNLQQFGLK